jgi:peptidoglycan/LPS O-acetylase OafA/YrhL
MMTPPSAKCSLDKTISAGRNGNSVKLGYRSDIDGLRAVAILLVVAFHAFPRWMRGGYVGVDVFFVISGYLISSIIMQELNNKNFRFFRFYGRRIKRIFPALLVVLVSCYVAGWYMLPIPDFKELGKQIAAGAGFVSNFLLWSESGYFDTAAEAKPLLHLWSLGVEEQFYLVWPAILWFTFRARIGALVSVALIAVISFGVNVEIARGDPVAAFYSPFTRFWELMLGSALAHLNLRGQPSLAMADDRIKLRSGDGGRLNQSLAFRDFYSASGGLLIVVASVLLTKETRFPGWWGILPTMGAYLIIASGPSAWFNRVVLSNRIMVWFGLISYPLYLWHWPLLSFGHIIEGGLTPEMRVSAVIVSIALAWATYQLVERPIHFGPNSPAKSFLLTSALAMVGAVGLATLQRGGFPGRHPEQRYMGQTWEFERWWRAGTCALDTFHSIKNFAPECVDPISNQPRPLVALWGDSHASALYPGLEAAKVAYSFRLAQFTGGFCIAVLNMDFKGSAHCRERNDLVLRHLSTIKPDMVLLAGYWRLYPPSFRTRIGETVATLISLGVKRVVAVGDVPLWRKSLPVLMSEAARNDPQHRFPERLQEFTIDSAAESQLRSVVEQAGGTYVSSTDILCNPDGCLTRTGEGPQDIMFWDAAHLTPAGSIYLVSHFPTSVFTNGAAAQ